MTDARGKAALCAFVVLASAPAAAVAEPLRLTFGQAVEMSLARAPDIASAREGVTAAELRASGTAAQRFPKLRTEANIFRWNEPLLIRFPSNGGAPATGAGATNDSSRFVARDQITTMASVALAQPISGLFVLHHLVEIDRSGAVAARADVTRARLDTASRAADGYLRLLQAKAVEEVAGKSLAQIEAQLAQAVTLEKGGVLSKVDVLRLTSSRDAARQGVVRAQTGTAVAMGALALVLDLRPDAVLEVVDDLPDPPPPLAIAEPDALRTAAARRPEVHAAAERTRQAHEAPTVAKAQLLPNLMAVGTYQHITGQGPFQPENAWFVGATLTWDVWDWGKSWDAVKEAGARARQADLGEKVVRDQIALEARRRLLEARAAFETLAPARTSLQAGEEAHRIQTVRYAAGTASTTDVIGTETDLSRARVAYAQARYDYYLAQAALVRAVGEFPAKQISTAVSGGGLRPP